jgi:peptidoglycan/LPS O-acetylase OafA/YrhL
MSAEGFGVDEHNIRQKWSEIKFTGLSAHFPAYDPSNSTAVLGSFLNATATDIVPAAPTAPTSTGAPPPGRKPGLPALTGVRTILALNIVFFHFTPPHMHYLYPVINAAYVFVGFFFLLSGFVLAYNYADRPVLSKRKFWLARFSRLYPVYLLSLAISFKMLEAEWQVRSHQQFFTGLTLTPLLMQGWNQSLATFWNTVAWTLSAEVVLYAAFPYLIRIPWPRTAGRLAALVVGIWAVGLIPHTLYVLLNPDHLPGPANRYSYGPWLRTLKYTPLPYVCIFLTGITLAKLHGTLRLSDTHRMWMAACSIGALVLFFSTVVAQTPYILLHGGLLVPLFSMLVLGLSGRHWIASVFAWRPIVLLGQTTFCLYLLHFNTINLIRMYHLPQRLGLGALDPWITYAAALGVAFAATFWFEQPVRRWLLARTHAGRA